MIAVRLVLFCSCFTSTRVLGFSGGFGNKSAPRRAAAPKYSKASLSKLADAFGRMRSSENVFDVYCGGSGGQKLFFVGKIATPSTEVDGAVATLRKTIEAHAISLQPLLAASQKLEIFAAPGNTEVAVAKGEQELSEEIGGGAKRVPFEELGFAAETYGPQETGFYVRR